MTEFEKLAFDKNLQEFASRVVNICGLEHNGKLTQEQAYQHVKGLWKQLKRSRKGLRIQEISERPDDMPDDLPDDSGDDPGI